MMPVNGVVTIFSFDKAKDEFVKKGVFHCWMRRMKRLRNTSRGEYYCDNFDVRIAIGDIDEINLGDMIYFGHMNEDFEMEKCRKIAVVSKNDYGLNPHWHLEAEYEYR